MRLRTARSEVRILSGAHLLVKPMILEAFSTGPVDTNAYLIGCSATKKAVVIDVPFDSADLILKRAGQLGLKIEQILLTHSHWDHTAEVYKLKKMLDDVPVSVHTLDAGNLEDPGSDKMPILFTLKGVKPDHLLEDKELLKIGNLRIQVIHTPGHTPGGICFYFPDDHVLVSGDTLFRGTIGNLSFPTGEPDLMWDSLKKLAGLPGDTKVYPGHGDPTTIAEEKWIKNAQERFK